MLSTKRAIGCRDRSAMAVRVVNHKAFFSPLGNPNRKFNKYEIKRLTAPSTVATKTKASPSLLQKLSPEKAGQLTFKGVHHVALLCSNLERALQFYQGILGLEINPDRPHHKLPYRGAWLWIGPEMIHLMELPNPDPLSGRPDHGGRDRHFCVGVDSVDMLVQKLEAAGIAYTKSMSGRPAVFFRDPDMNCLECVELEPWR